MKNTRIVNGKENTSKSKKVSLAEKTTTQPVEILYQKMGDRWYAFSLIGEEIFVGSISQAEIEAVSAQKAKIKKIIIPS